MAAQKDRLNSIASAFLDRGEPSDLDWDELAEVCNSYVRFRAQHSIPEALGLASRFVTQSRNANGAMLQTAYRASGWVNLLGGRYPQARDAYLTARKLVKKNAMARARIDRILVDVYMYLGDFAESRRRARLSMSTFSRLGAEADQAKTAVNYANVLHRQDRHRDAEKLYERAARYFQLEGNDLATARCSYNRANTLVQLFDFDEAEKLYAEAEKIYHRHGQLLDANDARYGLAWLRMLQGKFHVALAQLAECEQLYRETDQPKGAALCGLDRAEVFLNLHLFADALDCARAAESQFLSLGLRYEAAKASFFQAKAALALNKSATARSALARASEEFKIEKNLGFQAACALLSGLLARDSDQRKVQWRKARSVFSRAQLPTWQAVCDLHLASESPPDETALARLSRNQATREMPHLFASWQTLLGDLAYRSGDLPSARRHWRRAADRLDDLRAQLPPVDLRSAVNRYKPNPHHRLIENLMETDPCGAAVWCERYKTAGIWSPFSAPGKANKERARAEKALQELANQVVLLSNRVGTAGGERGFDGPKAHRAIAALQQNVRSELAAAERTFTGSADREKTLTENIAAASKNHPVIQWHVGRYDLAAFIHERGNTRVVRFPKAKAEFERTMRQWRFLLEGEALSVYTGNHTPSKEEFRFFETLGERLFKPLEIESATNKLVIIPEGELSNLPWSAVIVDGRPLLERHDLVISPSVRHFLRARTTATRSRRISLFAGPSDDLPEVRHELARLQDRAGSRCRLYDPCHRGDWPTDTNSRIWHFAGHASLRRDNPFYSYLSLADGPLFAADFRLRNCTVGLVTLAACRSGEQVALPGEESIGLARSLLEMGARNVIAGNWPVSDKSTALWMSTFYDQYLDGTSLGESVRVAAKTVRERYPSAYHWAAFACFGAGD
jgi:tetratricopeptide (TPR) repeat protein